MHIHAIDGYRVTMGQKLRRKLGAYEAGCPGHVKQVAFRQLVILNQIDGCLRAEYDAHGACRAESNLFVSDIAHYN